MSLREGREEEREERENERDSGVKGGRVEKRGERETARQRGKKQRGRRTGCYRWNKRNRIRENLQNKDRKRSYED